MDDDAAHSVRCLSYLSDATMQIRQRDFLVLYCFIHVSIHYAIHAHINSP